MSEHRADEQLPMWAAFRAGFVPWLKESVFEPIRACTGGLIRLSWVAIVVLGFFQAAYSIGMFISSQTGPVTGSVFIFGGGFNSAYFFEGIEIALLVAFTAIQLLYLGSLICNKGRNIIASQNAETLAIKFSDLMSSHNFGAPPCSETEAGEYEKQFQLEFDSGWPDFYKKLMRISNGFLYKEFTIWPLCKNEYAAENIHEANIRFNAAVRSETIYFGALKSLLYGYCPLTNEYQCIEYNTGYIVETYDTAEMMFDKLLSSAATLYLTEGQTHE